MFCRQEFRKKVNSAVFPGTQGGPLMHQIAGKAVALKEALEPEFAEYQRAVKDNARVLAKGLEERDFRIVSGGTDNHMVLVDLGSRMTGAEAEDAASKYCASRMASAFEIEVASARAQMSPSPIGKTKAVFPLFLTLPSI